MIARAADAQVKLLVGKGYQGAEGHHRAGRGQGTLVGQPGRAPVTCGVIQLCPGVGMGQRWHLGDRVRQLRLGGRKPDR